MDSTSKRVALTLTVISILCVYLISVHFKTNNLVVLACCIYAINAAVRRVSDQCAVEPAFRCHSEGTVVCPIKLLSEQNTTVLYLLVLAGGLFISSMLSPLLQCAWIVVSWKNLAVSYLLHSYQSPQDLHEATRIILPFIPIDWVFSFKHQHCPAQGPPGISQHPKTHNTNTES